MLTGKIGGDCFMKKTACVFLYGISTALLCGLIAPFLLCSCNASDEMKADSDPVTITTTDSTLRTKLLSLLQWIHRDKDQLYIKR